MQLQHDIIKRRGISSALTTSNTELPVTLYNYQKPLTNIRKSSTPDAAQVLYAPLKRTLVFLAWNSPPLDLSRIPIIVITINIIVIIIIIIIMIIIQLLGLDK